MALIAGAIAAAIGAWNVKESAHPSSPSPPSIKAPSQSANIGVNPSTIQPTEHSSDEELLEQSLAKLKQGNLAYNTPEKMKTGQTAHVRAAIGSDRVPISTLESGMPTDDGMKTEAMPTPVSTKMKMTLKSADFDISPLSSEEQFVSGDQPTSWEWDIAPKRSGKLRLHLAAVVELNGLSKDFTTVDREVAVQVDPVDETEKFLKENAKWLIGGLGTALAAGFAWFRRRKKPDPPKAASWETL